MHFTCFSSRPKTICLKSRLRNQYPHNVGDTHTETTETKGQFVQCPAQRILLAEQRGPYLRRTDHDA